MDIGWALDLDAPHDVSHRAFVCDWMRRRSWVTAILSNDSPDSKKSRNNSARFPLSLNLSTSCGYCDMAFFAFNLLVNLW